MMMRLLRRILGRLITRLPSLALPAWDLARTRSSRGTAFTDPNTVAPITVHCLAAAPLCLSVLLQVSAARCPSMFVCAPATLCSLLPLLVCLFSSCSIARCPCLYFPLAAVFCSSLLLSVCLCSSCRFLQFTAPLGMSLQRQFCSSLPLSATLPIFAAAVLQLAARPSLSVFTPADFYSLLPLSVCLCSCSFLQLAAVPSTSVCTAAVFCGLLPLYVCLCSCGFLQLTVPLCLFNQL